MKKIILSSLTLAIGVTPIVSVLACKHEEKFYILKETDLTKNSNGQITIDEKALKWAQENNFSLAIVGKDNHLKIDVLPHNFWSYFPHASQVPNEAFRGLGLSSMPQIPARITKIGDYAFATNFLKSINFEKHSFLTTIGRFAFYDNQISNIWGSDSIFTPNKLEYIGVGAFKMNQIASYVYLPYNLRIVDEEAFANNNISRLSIGGKVENIHKKAFFQERPIYRIKIYNTNTAFDGFTQKDGQEKIIQGLKSVFNSDWNHKKTLYHSDLNLNKKINFSGTMATYQILETNDQLGTAKAEVTINKNKATKKQNFTLTNLKTNNLNPSISQQEKKLVQNAIEQIKDEYHSTKQLIKINTYTNDLTSLQDLGINLDLKLDPQIKLEIKIKEKKIEDGFVKVIARIQSKNGFNLIKEIKILAPKKETKIFKSDSQDLKKIVEEIIGKIPSTMTTTLKKTIASEIGLSTYKLDSFKKLGLELSQDLINKMENNLINLYLTINNVNDKESKVNGTIRVLSSINAKEVIISTKKITIDGFQDLKERQKEDQEIVKEISQNVPKQLTTKLNKKLATEVAPVVGFKKYYDDLGIDLPSFEKYPIKRNKNDQNLTNKVDFEFSINRVLDDKGKIFADLKISKGLNTEIHKDLEISGYQTSENRKEEDQKIVEEIIANYEEEHISFNIDVLPSELILENKNYWKIVDTKITGYYSKKKHPEFPDKWGQVDKIEVFPREGNPRFAFAEVPNAEKTRGIPYEKWW